MLSSRQSRLGRPACPHHASVASTQILPWLCGSEEQEAWRPQVSLRGHRRGLLLVHL